MIELTGKQKRFLRSLGQRQSSILNVGKAGLSPALLAGLGRLLEQHELVKVHLPAASPSERNDMAAEMAEKTGAAWVGSVGRTALLYRPGTTGDADKRIQLPQAQAEP